MIHLHQSEFVAKLNLPYVFPIGIPSLWAAPNQYTIPDTRLESWLLDTGSLTERLKSNCAQFHLTLLGQRQEEITLEEFKQVCAENQCFQREDWQVREVLLWGDGQPWVFARSIIPQTLCESNFLNLNTMPLGQMIFNDRRFNRMPIEITNMRDTEGFLAALNLSHHSSLWGRRSVFCFENLKMMVSEIFLPNSPAYTGLN